MLKPVLLNLKDIFPFKKISTTKQQTNIYWLIQTKTPVSFRRTIPLKGQCHQSCLQIGPSGLKGTHARDFHSLLLNFFLHLSVTYRYKTQSSQHFRKYSLNSHRYSKFSITRRFRRKREAWLSVVAENAELNLALSSKLCVFGSFLERFRRKSGDKLRVFGENAELN
jgi:hypothetical protein